MRHKPLILLPVLVAIGILIYSIRRDSALEKSHPGDLRNRVVGARLQMDGITPYFYHWDSTAPVRYYDTSGYNHVAVSNITSTPYLHQLLYPIANLDQRLISRMWLWMQDIALAIAIGIAWKLATKKKSKDPGCFPWPALPVHILVDGQRGAGTELLVDSPCRFSIVCLLAAPRQMVEGIHSFHFGHFPCINTAYASAFHSAIHSPAALFNQAVSIVLWPHFYSLPHFLSYVHRQYKILGRLSPGYGRAFKHAPGQIAAIT